MNKPGWLKHSIAKADGYYTIRGEKLKSIKLTKQQITEWNGGAQAEPAPEPTPEPVVEEAPVEEVAAEEVAAEESVVEEKPAKKTYSRKKKK